MALPLQVLYRQIRLSVLKPVKCNIFRHKLQFQTCYPASAIYNFSSVSWVNQLQYKHDNISPVFRRYTTPSTPGDQNKITQSDKPPPKPSLFQRFKQMTRDYWYVMVPVHGITSVMWFGGFYYVVKSGVDVMAILESLHLSEFIMERIRNTEAGYFGAALACYKLATPLRYAVTIGASTFAIKRLTALGYIKPMPSKERIKEVFQEKKGNLKDKFYESKMHYQTQVQEKTAQMKEKRSQVLEEMNRYKNDIRSIKDRVKKM